MTHPIPALVPTVPSCRPEDLTPRELEIVELITRGLSNLEIASLLYLSINSVKTYIRSAYRKIGVETRPHAMVWGFTHGLFDQSVLREAPALDTAG